MPLIDDGYGLWTVNEKGEEVPAEITSVRMSVAVGDRKIFDYNEDTGVLELNKDIVSEGTLEQISKQIESNPGGINIEMGLPIPEGRTLNGVKSVRYFTSEEAVYEPESPYGTSISEKPKNLPQRIRNYFSNLF